MIPGSLIAAVVLAAGSLPAPVPGVLAALRFPTVLSLERIPLGGLGPVQMVAEPLTGTIELRSTGKNNALALRLRTLAGQICPEVREEGGAVVLHCRTRRFEATMISDRVPALEIRELRGLPTEGEGNRLTVFYDPAKLGFDKGCPGTTPGGRGECALRAGRIAEAAMEFRKALDSDYQNTLAALRLGDLALASGDAETAIGWYSRLKANDAFGRLGLARLCEVAGNCFAASPRDMFDGSGQVEPIRSELMLRGARAAAFAGDANEAARLIAEVLPPRGTAGGCVTMGELFCRRVMLFVLQSPGADGGALAVESYLDLPERQTGPLALPLVRAAAEKAAKVGAPQFGGNLLAASATWVDGPMLSDHLLRTAELYLQANDETRARVILEYAQSRLGKVMTGGRWAQVARELRAVDGQYDDTISAQDLLLGAGLSDVAAAFGAVARARAVGR